jgi:hypothetical protein
VRERRSTSWSVLIDLIFLAISDTWTRIVWDEEFRMTVYQSGNAHPKLTIRVYKDKDQEEDEMIGEAEIPIQPWKDDEYDGELRA